MTKKKEDFLMKNGLFSLKVFSFVLGYEKALMENLQ
jgi:hypothetical protein